MQRKEKKTGTINKVKEGRDRFMELINLLPQAVIEIQFDGTLLFANWHSRKLFGYSLGDDVVGKVNVFRHVIPEDRERIAGSIGKMASGEKVRPPEITAVRKDGSTFPAIVYANLIINSGIPAGVRVIVADVSDKKEIEEAYKALVDHSLQGLVIVQDGRFVFINDFFIRNSGFTREEILSLPIDDMWQMIHPEDREMVMGMHRNLLTGVVTQAPVIEYRVFVKGREGLEMRWVSDYGTRIEYRGRPAIQTALVDITERKLSEMAIQESERRYRDLAELLPQGVFEADTEGRILYANRSTLDMFGIVSGDIGQNITIADTLAVKDRDRAERGVRRVLAGEKVMAGEYTCIRKDGTTFPSLILANAIIKGGKPDGIRGVIVDITVRKEMNRKLEESEARYRTLFNSTGTATVLSDEDMRIVLANQNFYRISGYSQDTELKFTDLIHPDDLEFMVDCHRRRRIDPGSVPRSYEFRFRRADGSVRNAFLTVGMIPGTKRSVASIIDITELKQTQEELRKKTFSLEEANSALRVLLKQRDEDKAELEKNILTNLKEVVLPFLDKLKVQNLNASQLNILAVIEENLKEIMSPFLKNISYNYARLTPREIEILLLVKEGRSTKEISRIIHTSERTIDFQRNSIRKKLGISNSKVNLRTFIMNKEGSL
ncbi:MAG TPA: PAS domain S-box protein [Syntrophales bacterium]|nr:PAS domain S-box protein [Syntrophales bacterium]